MPRTASARARSRHASGLDGLVSGLRKLWLEPEPRDVERVLYPPEVRGHLAHGAGEAECDLDVLEARGEPVAGRGDGGVCCVDDDRTVWRRRPTAWRSLASLLSSGAAR